jgi:hypothetical protein
MISAARRVIAIRIYRFVVAVWRTKAAESSPVKYWEIIADNLSKAGWSWGCIATVDRERRTIRIADAHRGDGKRFIARSDEKLTAFVGIGKGGLYPPVERTNIKK